MSAKKKRQEAFKAKEKKQKIMVAVGGVLLVGILAFQVPRMMKQMHRGSAAAAAVPATVSTPTATSSTPSLAAPTTLRGEESTSSSDTGVPSAISSEFGSCDVPLMPSATTAAISDSIAPSIAIANAAGISSRIVW
jgi:hypothetical protein